MSAAREKERDTESLLLPHVLLTIGTLGHYSHPPPPQPQEPSLDHHHHNEASDDTDTKSEKENPPTMLFHSSTIEMHIINPELVVTDLKPKQLDAVMEEEEEEEEEIVSVEPLLKDPTKVEKRMTLAELFAAEPVVAAPASAVLTRSTITSSAAADKSFRKNKESLKEEKEKEKEKEKNTTKKKIHRVGCTLSLFPLAHH